MKPDTPIVYRVKNALMSIMRRSWEQCEAMQALLELKDYDTLLTFAKEVSYIQLQDGRTPLTNDWEKRTVTDPLACGEALQMAAGLSGDRLIKEAYEKLLDFALHSAPRSADGILYHMNDAPQFWVDSFYMCPPFFVAAGYYGEALKQVQGYWDALYDPEIKMLNWIWDDEKKEYVRTQHRSICTGYAALGLVKVAVGLPAKMKKEKDETIEKAKIVIDSILKNIDGDGVIHDTMDDPESIIGINAISMVAGAIYRAAAAGYLTEYVETAEKLRKSLHDKVDPYGFVYGVCGVPDNNKTGISSNGQSFFLMMEAAWYDYSENPVNRSDAWYNSIFRGEQGKRSDYIDVIRA